MFTKSIKGSALKGGPGGRVVGEGVSVRVREDIRADMWGGARGCGGVGIKFPHKEGMGIHGYVVACLIEEVKRVCVGRFEVGTLFQGETYSEDIEVLGQTYGRAFDFDGKATGVGPVTHSGVGEEVGEEVALFLDLLFIGSMGLSDVDNIQALGEIIKICVLDFRVITGGSVGIYVDSTELEAVEGWHGKWQIV